VDVDGDFDKKTVAMGADVKFPLSNKSVRVRVCHSTLLLT
jgi:hypothetical protein